MIVVVLAGAYLATAKIVGLVPFASTDDAEAVETAASTQQLVAVSEGTIAETVSAESSVVAAATESLSFASSGKVAEVLVAEGDVVTAGQLLARLDSAALRADFAEAQASAASLEAQLENSMVELWEYREDNPDEDDTYDDGDLLEDQIASTQARLAVQYDTLADAMIALAGADLVASIDGTVTTVDLTVGEQLGSGGASGTSMTGSGSGSGNSSGSIGSGAGAFPGQSSAGGSTSTGQIEIVSTGRYQVEL
ncbi:MAG TPA: biotin/lipoyl-binding protein, partial [Ilumatobacteraceae bacterium]|nr:biotin/lipoyl-binding protein [Ilumatobacteraceae bacterium]